MHFYSKNYNSEIMKSDKTTNIKKVFRLKDITLSLSILGAGALLTLFVPSWGWLGYLLKYQS